MFLLLSPLNKRKMMDAGPGRKGEGLPKLRDLLRRQREDSLTEVAFRRRPSLDSKPRIL